MIRVFIAMLLLTACGRDPISGCEWSIGSNEYAFQRCVQNYEYNSEECQDSATLVATTAGSPNGRTCSNKRHRMRVVPATIAGEEIGATVFCECERGSK